MIDVLTPSLMYRDTIKELNTKEVSVIEEESKGFIKNVTNQMSKNDRVLNRKELKRLRQECLGYVQTFFYDILGVDKSCTEIFITQSWLNMNRSGEQHTPHHHPNSVISGVLYLCTNENDAIYFRRESPFPGLAFQENEKSDSPVKLSALINQRVPIGRNEIILFPSDTVHFVERIDERKFPRISLAFNTNVRGKLFNEPRALMSAV